MSKSRRRFIALISAFSILVNSFSFWLPFAVLAQETPLPSPATEQSPEPTPENRTTPPPTVDTTTPTPELTPSPEATVEPSPSTIPKPLDQSIQTPAPGPSPLANYEPSPSATLVPSVVENQVEKVCFTEGQEIKDTVNEDWEINLDEGWAKTKEPVKLGVRYVFPQENKVTVTFKCLPKDGAFPLKIQKVKVSELKLPEDIRPYGEYAYDITTDMAEGTFGYNITLPKPENQEVKVSYLEDVNSEVKTVEEERVVQEGDKVKAEGIDHFTIYIATYSDNTFSVDKFQYARGETVYLKAGDLDKDYYYQIKLDPPSATSLVVSSCSLPDSNGKLLATYTLSASSNLGEWKAKLYRYTKSGCGSGEDKKEEAVFEVIATLQNGWVEPVCKYDPKGDESPKESDLFGLIYSAAFYKEEGGKTWFRERVEGDPLDKKDKFKESSWVVLFQNPSSEYYQYLLAVSGKGGGDDTVELWKNTSETEKVKWSPIFGDKPEDKIKEKKVKDGYARAYPDGNGNWFIEWGIETSELTNLGINILTWRLYFATSKDPNNFNKDHLDCYENPTTPTPTPTPAPYCGDGKVNQGSEQCDGTDGVKSGQNFCSSTCKLVPIYDGSHSCPAGTVKSQNPILTKTISATDADGETFTLSSGKYLFEASGTFRPTNPQWHPDPWADAGYTTLSGWSNLATQYGIHGTGSDYAAHALLADLGSGVGVVDWGNYNSDHIYTKYYEPTKSSVQFVIGDRYGDWFNTSWQNQTGMSDNSGNLTLKVYECQPVSEVKLCKTDSNQRPLSGWRLYILGDKVGNTTNIPSDGSAVNAGDYSNGNYVLLASGTYNYGDSRMIADASNSYRYVGLPCSGPTDGWVNGEAPSCMNNYLSLNFSTSGGPVAPGWGTYYNPQHKYAKAFSGGDLNLKIWDRCNSSQSEGCYSDNEGLLQLDVYKGYVGDTGEDGCVTFTNVPYGNYQLGEILQDGWQEASGSGQVVVNDSKETFTIVNNELPKLGNLEVTKVVDWKNTNPNTSKTFEICIAGPSYPSGNCKNSDYDGQVLSWTGIQIGEYTITETNPGANWIVTGSGQKVTVNKDQTTTAQIKNELNPVTIKAYKVVCDSEAYLPNWGNHGSVIGATTAQDFVNTYDGHCRLEDGWKFQYGPAGAGSFGSFQTNISELGSPWVTFGPTVSGEATAVISDLSGFGGRIEAREVFKNNTYFPFSNNGNVSAEFYCTGDVYNYDNWEWINNPQYGQTYYCVAFNAPNETKITGRKFNDLNYNGSNDDSEQGLEGWKILAAQKIDELTVTAQNMPTVTSNVTLELGTKYLLRVSGTYGAGDNITADAKYSVRAPNTLWTDSVQNYESYGQTLLDLQINEASPNWGSYNPSHVYWLTYTGSGSPINLRLYDIYPPNNTGGLDVKIYKVLSETTTSSDGSYNLTLSGSLGSDIIIAEETKDGWIQTAPNGGNFGYCNITPYQENACNFGNALAYGSISGYKYEDFNGNGQRDEGEDSLLSGWTIKLKQNSSVLATTTTGNGGSYSFLNVAPGDYQVCEVNQDDWRATDPNSGDVSGEACKKVTVSAGQNSEVGFGNFKLGKITGYKHEYDDNTRENTGVSGWTIFIDENEKNGILDEGEKNVETNNDGYFEFTGLTAGTYSICEVEQSGWQRMYPSGSNCQDVVITSGTNEPIYFKNRQVVLGLSLTKSNDASGALSSGGEVTYTLIVKNTGNQRLTGVTIKDAPAGGFTYVSDSGLIDGTTPVNPTISGGALEWYIGTLEASGEEGDTKTLTYKMKSDSTLSSGIYPNIAIATGIYTPSEYENNESDHILGSQVVVEALAEEVSSEGKKVESNAGTPVNSEVELKQALAYSTGVGVVGQVLGASTEAGQVLPAAGSDTRILLFALLALIFGLFFKFGSLALAKNWIDYRRLKKGIKSIFASLIILLAFSFFAPLAKAFTDYVSITKLATYINKEDFKVSYAALSENPVTAQFYIRKDGDSSWRNLGSSLTGASGYVEVHSGDIYGGDGKYFFKVVINGGTAEDETSTIIDRQAPDSVRDYWKEKLGDGHYRLHWRNPDNEDFDKVIIYRSDSTNFTADSTTEIATIWGSRNAEMTSESSAAGGKEYYFAIRAIDKAGNASGVVSDPETQVAAGAVLGTSTSATSQPEVVKLLPKEKKGEVLGEEKTEEATPSPTEAPKEEKGGVLGEAVKFAKNRTTTFVLLVILGVVVLYSGFNLLKKRKK